MPGTSHLTDFLLLFSKGFGAHTPYAAYTPALVAPPDGAEVIGVAQLVFELGLRMGLPLMIKAGPRFSKQDDLVPLDMTIPPTDDELS